MTSTPAEYNPEYNKNSEGGEGGRTNETGTSDTSNTSDTTSNVAVEDRVQPDYVNPEDANKPPVIQMREQGFAIATSPDPHLTQVNIAQPDGSVDNYVGPRVQPLVAQRDGGPYLDEVEASKEDLRRQHVMDRQTVLTDAKESSIDSTSNQESADKVSTPVAPVVDDTPRKKQDEFGLDDL